MELIGRHVINNLQIYIASGATGEQADNISPSCYHY